MAYCIYLRKSRSDMELEAKGELETLARHEKILLEYARRQNLSIGKIYKEVVSGETISARPEMQKLLDDVDNCLWDGVLVMEVERLARGDTIDQGVVARSFKNSSTKIITPVKTYDPSNEFDEEYFEFGLFMSRREYKTINRRIQRGRVQSAKEGKFIGSTPPYGYDKVRIPGDKGYTLRPNDGEAETVKAIFDFYTSGDGCNVIASKLDRMRAPVRNGDVWSKSTVHDILCNPVYTGKIRWSYRVPDKTGKRGRIINDDCILADGLHPALVDDETFERAQHIMASSARLPVKKDLTLKNPLTGLGYCKKCGSMLTRLGPNKHCPYDTLRCSNRYCDNVSAPLDLVEQEVYRQVVAAVHDYRLALEQSPAPVCSSKTAVIDKSIASVKNDIQKIDKQISSTYDLLEQGVYSTEVFTGRHTTLSSRRAELETTLKQLIADREAAEQTQEQRRELPEITRLLDGYYDVQDAKLRNRILRGVLVKFEYVKDTPNHRGGRDNRNFSVDVYLKLPK